MSHCRDCGQEIVWGQDDASRMVPLDRRPDVYKLEAWDQIGNRYAVTKTPNGYYVDHRATCPKVRIAHARARKTRRPDARRAAAGE